MMLVQLKSNILDLKFENIPDEIKTYYESSEAMLLFAFTDKEGITIGLNFQDGSRDMWCKHTGKWEKLHYDGEWQNASLPMQMAQFQPEPGDFLETLTDKGEWMFVERLRYGDNAPMHLCNLKPDSYRIMRPVRVYPPRSKQ